MNYPKHVASGQIHELLHHIAEGHDVPKPGEPYHEAMKSLYRFNTRYFYMDSAYALARAAGCLCGLSEDVRAYLIERMELAYTQFLDTYDDERNFRFRA